MKLTDFSPSPSPSLDQQRDALQKGLGRAMQWARDGRLDDEPLLDACLHDRRYDSQCEDNRGGWLWSLIVATGAVERFRAPVLASFRQVAEEPEVHQLCELAFRYAESGDSEFEDNLYEFVRQRRVSDCSWAGEEQLLELSGETAFRFIVRIRGELLEGQEWDWDDGAIVDRAIEKLGKDRVVHLLDDSADVATRRFAEAWKQRQIPHRVSDQQSYSDRMRAISDSDVLEAVYGADKCYWLRGWGRYAEPGDLETIIHVLGTASDPRIIAKLLTVFSRRALPRFQPWLIDLCRHDDEEVKLRAFQALGMNSHPLVRKLALSELGRVGANSLTIGLFTRNFVDGDEKRLLDRMELPDDDDLRHSLLFEVLDVLTENPDANCSKLAAIAYFHMPCGICRFRAVKRLAAQRVAPQWMMAECKHDSDNACCALFH